MDKFNYENTEIVAQKGGKVVRKVSIKKGRGHKTITKYHRGKKMYTIKKPIHSSHIKLIQKGKFIPGLFKDCKNCKTKKRRGGDPDYDIEMGPQPRPIDPYKVPADPERYKQQELNIIRESLKPIPASKAEAVFDGPTPEPRSVIESNTMIDEDPRFKEPFQREELEIFKRGGRRTRRKDKYHHKRHRYSRKGGDRSIPFEHKLEESSDHEDDHEDDHDQDEEPIDPRLQILVDMARDTEEHIAQLDNQLYAIEQMSDEERAEHKEEEEHLKQELKHLLNTFEEFKEAMTEIFGVI